MDELNTRIEKTSFSPGAAYIRYSTSIQRDSFSLDAQLRQIKEQAERDGVEIVSIFSDPATSAYRKKYRPGINAMRAAARRGEFEILYVHKVDRLARRLEWCLEIVHELQSFDIIFKAVQQPFDLSIPEGKLLFHLISSLGEFYADNVSKETHKGKLERALQGYHNGAVPWGYVSQRMGSRNVGVPDVKKAPVVLELFEHYVTGQYSDAQLAAWLNEQNYKTSQGNPFSRHTVRDMLCNPYYNGQIRYRGWSMRQKGVSYRSTTPKLIQGQHEPIVSDELWQRVQRIRASRRLRSRSRQRTSKVYLLQGIIVCAHCRRPMRAQTVNRDRSYYRKESRETGFPDCPFNGKGVKTSVVDHQIAELIQSFQLPELWEEGVYKLEQERDNGSDFKARRKKLRGTLVRIQENFDKGLYKYEENVYRQKVKFLQGQLEQLDPIPDNAICQAASTLLELSENWNAITEKERQKFVNLMIQEVAYDIESQQILWFNARPEFGLLFQLFDHLILDAKNRFWL